MGPPSPFIRLFALSATDMIAIDSGVLLSNSMEDGQRVDQIGNNLWAPEKVDGG